MIKLDNINATYDIVDYERLECDVEIFDENDETIEKEYIKTISKYILLRSDTNDINNILVVKHYEEDEYKTEGFYEILTDAITGVTKGELISNNINKGMVVIGKIEGTTSDIELLMNKNFETIDEYFDFMDLIEDERLCYKYTKLENNKWEKLV